MLLNRAHDVRMGRTVESIAPAATTTATAGKAVAVIGLGFSGTAVAVGLLSRLPPGSRLLLVEPAARRARGLAYGTRCASHWLNVPAGRLGLDPAHEAGFIEWLRAQHGNAYAAADFVPRMLLGDYLGQSLAEAEQAARARGVEVINLGAGVRSLRDHAGGKTLLLDDGRELLADAVVLCTGHLPPEQPRVPGAPAWDSPGLVAEPWGDATLANLPEDGEVLLLGSGLSAIDVLTWLQDRGHAGRVTMLSRRGLLPQPHRSLEARPHPGLSPARALAACGGLRAMLRAVRGWAAGAPADGHDWRDVMASLRGCTPALWQGLSERERRQFLRHLQPWWDTHRHRLAPGIHRRLSAALAAGQVELHAGRLRAIRRVDNGQLSVAWAPRGGGQAVERRVAAVVNCTGPSARIGRAPAGSLLATLQAQGRLLADALGQGMQVDGEHRLLDVQGQGQPGLYYVGPMLKAQHWEAVAIPELRVHAKAVVEQLLTSLKLSA
jgi:uncharacterized NAD(P)/FAD-binding protein YdhS